MCVASQNPSSFTQEDYTVVMKHAKDTVMKTLCLFLSHSILFIAFLLLFLTVVVFESGSLSDCIITSLKRLHVGSVVLGVGSNVSRGLL